MIKLLQPHRPVNVSITLAGSKSISNRLLIIGHVLNLELDFQNISNSQDTLLLQKALLQIKAGTSATIDIQHAGSDLRFLTALLSVTEGEWIITGSERIKQRPVGELVTALNFLGADIQYLEARNFPPLKIKGKKLNGGKIEIDGSVSSQFVSALLLISPALNTDLEIILKGEIVSQSYIQMTISLLKEFGLNISLTKNTFRVAKSNMQRDQVHVVKVESDWSSASYWYSICALSEGAQIELQYFNQKSLQGDSVLSQLYSELGVESVFNGTSVFLKHKKTEIPEFRYHFSDCPDLAQTVAVTCFGLGIKATLTGLSTLKIKETDRIVALKTELEKFGAAVTNTADAIVIDPGALKTRSAMFEIATYNDHRMAMSFAPLALLYDHLTIRNPEVVAKSYPRFWEDLKSAGFSVNLQA